MARGYLLIKILQNFTNFFKGQLGVESRVSWPYSMHPFNFFMLTTVRSERVKRENMALTDKNKVSMFSRLFSCCLDDTLVITELTVLESNVVEDNDSLHRNLHTARNFCNTYIRQ